MEQSSAGFFEDERGGKVANPANSPWSSVGLPSTMDPVRDLEIDVRSLPEKVSPPGPGRSRPRAPASDPGVFFPTTEEEAGLALSYCSVCQVRDVCLAWAVRNGERYGVWGGTTEQQRRRLIRQVA